MEKYFNIASSIIKNSCYLGKKTLFASCGVDAYKTFETLLFLISNFGDKNGFFLGNKQIDKKILGSIEFREFSQTHTVYLLKILGLLLLPILILFKKKLQQKISKEAIEDIVKSSLMRSNHIGSTEELNKDYILKLKVSIYKILVVFNFHFWIIFLKKSKIERVILVDRGYTPWGELFEAAIALNIDLLTWNLGHTKSSILLKRYTNKNKKDHCVALSQKSFESIISTDLNWDHLYKKTKNKIETSYSKGEWWSEVGTSNQHEFFKKGIYNFKNKVKFKNYNLSIMVAAHILHDATFFWGSNIFSDYKDWLIQTITAAINAPKDIIWIIKLHPANTVKNFRDGIKNISLEEEAIIEKFNKLPENIVIIKPDEPVSALDIIKLVDVVITVRGTVGLEGMLYGKAVITAGSGSYDKKGGSIDFDKKSSYLSFIKNPNMILLNYKPKLSLMKKIAISNLYIRPYTLYSMTVEHDKSNYSLPVVNLSYDNSKIQTDISAISRFLDSDATELLKDNF